MNRILHVISVLLCLLVSLPLARAQQTVFNNGTTTAIKFPGTACNYKWTVDHPEIGLDGSGTGFGIPSFTAINPGTTDITATITATVAPGAYNDFYTFMVNQLQGKLRAITYPSLGTELVIGLQSESYGIAISKDRDRAYVTNRTSGTVSVMTVAVVMAGLPLRPTLDLHNIATVPVGSKPQGVAISPDGSKVYVVNSGDATISVITAADVFSPPTTIPITGILNPSGIVVGPDNSKLYITGSGSGIVTVLNIPGYNLNKTVPAGRNPQGIAVTPDGKSVYIANQDDNSVSVINTTDNTIKATIKTGIGNQPFGITSSPDGTMIYVTNQADNTVSAINTSSNTVTKTYAVGKSPRGISTSPDGSLIFTANFDDDKGSVIDIATGLVTTYDQDKGPFSFGNFIEGPVGCVAGPVQFTITVKATPPTINWDGSLTALSTAFGAPSAAASFNVSGLSLKGGVKVVPPNGFEVSLDGVNFSPDVTISASGNLQSTPVYIRLAATTPQGVYSGDIKLSSPGATDVLVPMPNSTVRPPEPTIITSGLTGSIYTCAGQVSTSPNIMQFIVSAVNLKGILSASATTGFEISLTESSGYSSNITVGNDENIGNMYIYIRASTAITAGTNIGTITLTSPGATTQKISISGVAYKVPTASPVTPPSQEVVNQNMTTPVHFTGTGNTFIWKNDHPEINLADNGTGDIASFKAINNTNDDITATITAWPVSYPLAYVANFSGNSVSVISINTGENIATISTNYGTETGSGPKALVVNADATRVYVANYVSNNVTVIDASTNVPIAIIKVGEAPQGLMLSADGSKLYVFNSGGPGSVSTISTATNAVTGLSSAATIPPTAPMSPDGKLAYVYSYDTYNFSVYNVAQKKIIATLPGNTSPQGLVLSPDGKTIYLSDFSSNNFYIIDAATNTRITTIPLHLVPQGIGISRDGKWVYITMASDTGDGNGQIAVINTETQEEVNEVNVGNFPSAVGTTGGTGCEGTPITYTYIVHPTPPTITAKGNPDAMTTIQGNASVPPSTFTVSGIKMQEGILVTPPSGFEVSLDGITFSPTVTIPGTGTIADTKVYIRLAASTPVGKYAGDIVFTSKNAATVKLTMPECEVYLSTSSIIITQAGGSINTCEGAPSASPNVMQFTASGFLLTGDITITAPTDFEVSTNLNGGYSKTIVLNRIGTDVAKTTIYIRSAITAKGSISGDVTLTTPGATNRTTAVKANVGVTPKVDKPADQTKMGGIATDVVTFTGTGNSYSWTNDNTTIGLAASGYGDIASFTAINKGGTPQVANVTVTPLSAAFAYVALFGTNRVALINTATNNVSYITVDQAPYAVAASPDGKFVYVANQTSNTVSVINTTTNKVVQTISVGRGPSGIVVSADGRKIYVANGSESTVTMIDAATYATTTMPVGVGPDGMALSTDGEYLYVVNRNATNVFVIDVNTLAITKVTTGRSPEGIAVSPDGTRIYVTNYTDRTVTVIDATTNTPILPAIPVQTNPRGIAVSIDGTKLYVANSGSGSVSIIDTKTNAVVNVTVGNNPQGVSVSPNGSLVYVANSGSNSISVISTATSTVTGTISNVGASPVSFGNFITGGAGCVGNSVNFKITVNPESAYMTTTGNLPPLSTTYGTPSSSGIFDVTGISLTGAITVTPPVGIEVSTDNITYKPTLSFTPAKDGVATTIYVRLSATAAAKTYTDKIILSSPGATNANVNLTATTKVDPAALNLVANKVTKTVNTLLTGGPGSKAFTYTGIKNNENIGTVTITYGAGAEISAALGTYTGSVKPSDPVGGTFTASNYVITPVSADLIVSNIINADLIRIPNAFSPNGDGINDTWKIDYLTNFSDCIVNIYDRSGRPLYHSVGYSKAWDGTFGGKYLPYGTYYYVIDIDNGAKRLSGYVLLIR